MSRFVSVRNAGRNLRSRHLANTAPTSGISKSTTRFNSHSLINPKKTIHLNARRFNSNLNHSNRDRNLTAAQLQLHLSKVDATASGNGNANVAIPSFSELTAWILHKTKVPKGESVSLKNESAEFIDSFEV